MIEIQYIGNKPVKRDTVAGTATVWEGNGDVRAVPETAARILVRHPDVWAAIGTSDVPEAPKSYGPAEERHTDAAIHDQIRSERLAAEKVAPLMAAAAEEDPPEQPQQKADPQPLDRADTIERIAAVMRALPESEIGERGKPLMSAVRARLDGFQFTRAEYDAAMAAAGF